MEVRRKREVEIRRKQEEEDRNTAVRDSIFIVCSLLHFVSLFVQYIYIYLYEMHSNE